MDTYRVAVLAVFTVYLASVAAAGQISDVRTFGSARAVPDGVDVSPPGVGTIILPNQPGDVTEVWVDANLSEGASGAVYVESSLDDMNTIADRSPRLDLQDGNHTYPIGGTLIGNETRVVIEASGTAHIRNVGTVRKEYAPTRNPLVAVGVLLLMAAVGGIATVAVDRWQNRGTEKEDE